MDRFFDEPAALLVAHPGHELLVHHVMEQARPVVFVLTDGSGGHAPDRRAFSRRLIEAAGAEAGPVFGPAPDRAWYRAILAGELSLFLEARAAIARACQARGVRRLVADPVELFNPMHDLCAALAAAVAADLRAAGQDDVRVYDFSIEAERSARSDDLALALDPAALARKIAAAKTYAPLWDEIAPRIDVPAALTTERLRRTDGLELWPERPAEEPFYEVFGRRRVAEGGYRDLITYAGHVRPIAAALGAASPVPGETLCARPQSSPFETNVTISATA